jgi:hypothetical protein
LVGSLGLSCRYKRFLFCFGCPSRLITNFLFSSAYTFSLPLFTSPNKLCRQPCWVACLLVCVSGQTYQNCTGVTQLMKVRRACEVFVYSVHLYSTRRCLHKPAIPNYGKYKYDNLYFSLIVSGVKVLQNYSSYMLGKTPALGDKIDFIC